MRLVASVCVVVSALAAIGCGGQDADRSTSVTITAVNPTVGQAVFHLSCRPAGGDVPDPARACASVAATPDLLTHPKPFTCAGGTFSWWEITISGSLAGRAFQSATSTCWTPQMRLIDALGIGSALPSHLLPRRRQRMLAGGAAQVFPPGRLRPGDLVVCEQSGVRVEGGVPASAGQPARYGHLRGGRLVVGLTVTRNPDSSIAATCDAGDAAILRVRVMRAGQGGWRNYELRCEPPGGSVPEPARTCRTLATEPELLEPAASREGPCGWRYPAAIVRGAYRGRRIGVAFDSCIGSQAARAARWAQIVAGRT